MILRNCSTKTQLLWHLQRQRAIDKLVALTITMSLRRYQPFWKLRIQLMMSAIASLILVLCAHSLQQPLPWIAPTYAQISQPHQTHFTPAFKLPKAETHPLPTLLSTWHDPDQSGDYFDQVPTLEVGYLIWSEFPVRVYVEPITADHTSALQVRSQVWHEAVTQAVQDWQPYFPLQIETNPDAAHIKILRRSPPLQVNAEGQFRSRAAETRYAIYRQRSPEREPTLTHRVEIFIRPDQSVAHLQGSARHEIGHALGIWGHSPFETDALYYSQVRSPDPISARDINTLKRIYQQPTRLGWVLPK